MLAIGPVRAAVKDGPVSGIFPAFHPTFLALRTGHVAFRRAAEHGDVVFAVDQFCNERGRGAALGQQVNAALVALSGFQAQGPGSVWLTLLLPILGILVSLLWLRIIRSHRDLNDVKFTIIHDLEEHLPAAVFTHEWRLAIRGKGKTYRPVTEIERWIPLVFVALHLVLLVLFGLKALSTGATLPSG